MNVPCPECRSVFRVDPRKVPARGVRARCSVCGGILAIATTGSIDAEFDRIGEDSSVPSFTSYSSFFSPESRTGAPAATETASRPATPAQSPAAAPAELASSAEADASQLRVVHGAESVAPELPVHFPPRLDTPPGAPLIPPAASFRRGTPANSVRSATPASELNVTPPPHPAPSAATGEAVSRVPQTPSTPRPSQTPYSVSAPGSAKGEETEPRAAPQSLSPALGSSVAPSPSVASTPTTPRSPLNPYLASDPNLKARRLARVLVSDMVVYHPEKREEGLRSGTLKQLFREEIKKSYEEYVEQVGKDFAESTAHFQEALNEILAGGKRIF